MSQLNRRVNSPFLRLYVLIQVLHRLDDARLHWGGQPIQTLISSRNVPTYTPRNNILSVIWASLCLDAAAKSRQSCPTLRPHRRHPTGSSVPGILQARTLEWVAISFSNTGFSRQEHWSGLPFPSLICLDKLTHKINHHKNVSWVKVCSSVSSFLNKRYPSHVLPMIECNFVSSLASLANFPLAKANYVNGQAQIKRQGGALCLS